MKAAYRPTIEKDWETNRTDRKTNEGSKDNLRNCIGKDRKELIQFTLD